MGKRKKSSRKPTGPKKRDPLPTSFKCVFCNSETSVSVKIDKKAGVGNLNCKSCGQNYQCGVNYLSQPVDVYADWVDACEAVAEETAGTGTAAPASSYRPSQAQPPSRAGLAPGEKYTDEDNGFIDDDDADGEAAYADEDD